MEYRLRSIKAEFHCQENFREQIAVLYLVHQTDTHVTLLRDFIQVCQPGLASFDKENPGGDTFKAWEEIDRLIETEKVVGVFHTHPEYAIYFSSQDIMAQNGLSKSNGSKYLWHGIQPYQPQASNAECKSQFCCVWMINNRVFRFYYEWIDDNLNNPVVILPVLPNIEFINGAYVLTSNHAKIFKHAAS